MAQHQSRSEIIVGGRTDSTFFQMMNNVNDFGMQLTHLTEGLRQFGSDALEVYRKYEDGMLETRSVLYKKYGAGELNKVMSELEKSAQKWAQTTIFHTDDVANAMAEAAHAGWDYEKILEGIPSAMLIAQAGGLELSDSVDMLAKMLAATGTAFSDSGKFIDQWARSSDLVATDIGEMGEAFLRLGAAAQFTDSNEELFTMLAVLAQVGTTGSNAGTAVRNMMVRLIAPTEKAAAAMEELGISDDEVAEAFEGLDAASAAAYERLKEFGFDPYDEHGNLKGFIEIFTDLNAAIEELPDEQEQNKILSAIFPTRTLAYAKAMLAAVKDGSIFSIYDAIYGDSEGYAQGKSDILMSGITGDLEILASKWEETKRRIGESMSMDVSWGAAFLGSLLDKINNMDPILLDALVGAFEALAVAGPMLTVGAGGFGKLAGLVASHPYATMILLAAMSVTALAKAMGELEQQTFENQFGEMDLDTDALLAYVNTVNEKFTSAYSSVNTYKEALEEATTKYQEASSALSGKLTTAMITGSELTKEDVAELKNLGQRMGAELINGINSAFDASTEYRLALMGDDAFNDPTMAAVAISMKRLKDDMVEAAGSLGDELGAAMDAAFEDGIITGEELNIIRRKMDAYNQAMAEMRAIEERAEVITQMRKAQSVSWDSYADFMTQSNAKFDQTEAELEEQYQNMTAWDQAYMEALIEGEYINELTGEAWTEADMNAALLEYEKNHAEEMARARAQRKEVEEAAFEALMQGYDGYDAYKEMEEEYRKRHWDEGGSFLGKTREERTNAYLDYLINSAFDLENFDPNTQEAYAPYNEAQEKINSLKTMSDFLTGLYMHGQGVFGEEKLNEIWGMKEFYNALYESGNAKVYAANTAWLNNPKYNQMLDRIAEENSLGTEAWTDAADAVVEPIVDFFFGTLASAEEYTEDELAAMAGKSNPFADVGKGAGTGSLLGLLTSGLYDYYTEGLNGKIPGTLGGTGAFASGLLAAILSGGGMLNAGGIGGIPFQSKLAQLMGTGNPYINGLQYLVSTGARGALGLPAYNEGGFSTRSIVFGEGGRYSDEQLAQTRSEASGLLTGMWRLFSTTAEAEEYAEEQIARMAHEYTPEELAAMQAEYGGKYGKANGIWAMFGMPNPFARAGEGTGTGSLLGLLTSGLFNYYTEGLNGKIPGTLGGTGVFASGLLAAILSGGGMLNAGGIGGIPFQGKLAQLMGTGNPYLNGLQYLVSTGARGAFGLPAYNEGGFSTSSIVFGDAGEYAEEQMAEMQEAADAGIEIELLPTPDGKQTAQVFIEDAQAMLTSKPGKWQITPIMMGGGGGGGRGGGGGGLGTLFGASGGGLMYLPTELQYAEGGRATTASIFGENGAEWAIPEEHSTRTAALLDAARRASGFTWGEILAAYGGLNAGGGSGGQLVYSPTIYAGDARGVKEALAADKARLDKWWRDKERRDSLEVYA